METGAQPQGGPGNSRHRCNVLSAVQWRDQQDPD